MIEGEWDLQVNDIIEKTCDKMKYLNKTKDQLEQQQIALMKERESLEKVKLELKFMVSKLNDETIRLSQSQLELQNINQKLKVQLFLEQEKLKRMDNEFDLKRKKYNEDFQNSSNQSNDKQEMRNNDITNMLELQGQLLKEKSDLELDLANKTELVISLQNQIQGHNESERKKINKASQFNSIVETLYSMSGNDQRIKQLNSSLYSKSLEGIKESPSSISKKSPYKNPK